METNWKSLPFWKGLKACPKIAGMHKPRADTSRVIRHKRFAQGNLIYHKFYAVKRRRNHYSSLSRLAIERNERANGVDGDDNVKLSALAPLINYLHHKFSSSINSVAAFLPIKGV